MSTEPYLSVVATSRNDDHGGNLQRRMQLFVSGWIEQCKRHQLDAELLLVEWNPPEGRESLATALRWPSDTGPCRVRIVTVPPEVHRRYRHAEALPLFQMIAKNVGIRRARAPFVLATNIDILFNDDVMRFLAARRLERGRLYRIDRSDAMADVPLAAGIVEQLDYCRGHLLRINGREATFDPGLRPEPIGTDEAQAGIGFGDGFGCERTAAGELYHCAEGEAVLSLGRPRRSRVLRMLVEAGPNPDRTMLAFEIRDSAGRSIASVPFRDRRRIYLPLPDWSDAEMTLRLSVGTPQERRWGPKQLQLRILECGWATTEELRQEGVPAEPSEGSAVAVRDIFDPRAGITLNEGWGERAWSPAGQLFREVPGRAAFSTYTAARLPGHLVLELEAEELTQVRVRTSDAVMATSAVVGSRRLVIPSLPATKQATRFSIESDRLTPGPERTTGEPARLRVCGLRRAGLGPALRTLLWPLARPRIDYLHTNGCGDFTLMHCDHWFHLRGYPEWEAYSMNIDGFTCYAAHADGLRETVLREPLRIYHIEHGLGSGWSPEGEQQLYHRITSRGIRWIDKHEVLEYARRMYREGPLIVNKPSWGLAEERLSEVRPGLFGSQGEPADGTE